MESSALTPEEQFLKYHDRLREELNWAHTHHEICKTLRKHKSDYLNEMNAAPSFFGLTIDAHLFATIMSINKLIDEHSSSSLKMTRFFEFIEGNFSIFSDESYIKHLRVKGYDDEDCGHWLKKRTKITRDTIKEDRQVIKNIPIENLKDWRDKKLAHIDEKYVLTDTKVSQKSPITSADIDKIINKLHGILNRYLLAYDGSGWEIGLPAGVSDQIVYVLDSIRLHRHQHAKKSLPKSAKKPNQKRHFILILYEQFKELSESTGIIFLIFGVIFLVLAVVLLQVNSVQEVASRLVFPTALATISLGIGFIAVGVTVKSDKRYSELLGRILHQVEDLPYKLGDKVRLPSVLGDYSKEAAQKRLDEDTKNNRGQPRGELFEVEKGKWAIYWGGKYPL